MNDTRTDDQARHVGAGWSPRRIAILGGSGLTGSGLAYQLAQSAICDEVVLFDLKENVLEAHVVDMREAQIVTGRTHTRLTVGSLDDVAAAGECDLVVVAASLPEKPDGDRIAFLEGNLGVVRSLVPAIRSLAGSRGLIMLLTNPADLLATALADLGGIAPERVFGYCLNDTVRLAAAVARELQVDPAEVGALVLGEHGDGQVPIYSRLTVSGEAVTLTTEQRQRIDEDSRGWFRRWSQLQPGRSSGWTTPVGSALTIERLAAGIPVPVAAWAGSMEGLADVHITLMSVVSDSHVIPDPAGPRVAEWERVQHAASSLAARVAALVPQPAN